MRRSLVTALIMLLSFAAATAQPVEMADSLRGSGKIYVVVAVICVILIALIAYLFSIDRRLKKLEKRD